MLEQDIEKLDNNTVIKLITQLIRLLKSRCIYKISR